MANYFLPLVKREEIAEDTWAFEFKKPPKFSFIAGQTIDVGVGTMMNTFSIAASPDEPVLRIATRIRKESQFKQALFKAKTVRIQGPSGDFVLPKSTKRPIVMIAGGIGITPFYSMITSAPPHKISLFYKNSTTSRAAFLGEFKSLRVSRFKVFTGFKHLNVKTLKQSLFYLAGPPGFVAKYRKILDSKGINEDNIRTEEFSGY